MRSIPIVAAVLLLAAFALALSLSWRAPTADLVVYCAHDAIHSEQIIRRFEEETGLKVDVRFDTEATKSLGLTQRLINEKANPVADVYWNNQLMGTLDLIDQGILAPFDVPNAARIPDTFKDPDGRWVGFGARLRVHLFHTDTMQPSQEAIAKLLADEPERVALAKPLYGTTRTHYTVLWKLLGGDALKSWHEDRVEAGLRVVASNGATRDLAANGTVTVGITDTDDAFGAIEAGRPVAMLPVRVGPENRTISIPNTVGIVAGAPNREVAERFADFLLSEEIEIALANGSARQIPLGPVDQQRLPEDLRELTAWAADGVDLSTLGSARQDCLAWLTARFQ
jgi:iron(III) transport system substrate-binding protein